MRFDALSQNRLFVAVVFLLLLTSRSFSSLNLIQYGVDVVVSADHVTLFVAEAFVVLPLMLFFALATMSNFARPSLCPRGLSVALCFAIVESIVVDVARAVSPPVFDVSRRALYLTGPWGSFGSRALFLFADCYCGLLTLVAACCLGTVLCRLRERDYSQLDIGMFSVFILLVPTSLPVLPGSESTTVAYLIAFEAVCVRLISFLFFAIGLSWPTMQQIRDLFGVKHGRLHVMTVAMWAAFSVLVCLSVLWYLLVAVSSLPAISIAVCAFCLESCFALSWVVSDNLESVVT